MDQNARRSQSTRQCILKLVRAWTAVVQGIQLRWLGQYTWKLMACARTRELGAAAFGSRDADFPAQQCRGAKTTDCIPSPPDCRSRLCRYLRAMALLWPCRGHTIAA